MLLSRILFSMHFSSIHRMWPVHCSLFSLIIFDMLGSSNCLYLTFISIYMSAYTTSCVSDQQGAWT
jgi:hypothetical protein